MTHAQQRLLDTIRSHERRCGIAEYWPVVNDWVRDAGPTRHLALTNIFRTVNALIRDGIVSLDNDGYFHASTDI